MRTTVVIPVYNGASVLPTTVPAALALDGVDEWVWIDDGSTDRTSYVLSDLLAHEPRATLLRLATNQGRSAARNRGLEATTGEFVVFIDADVRPPRDAALRLIAAIDGEAVASVGHTRPVLDRPDDPFQRYLAHHPRGPSGLRYGVPIPWKYLVTCVCAVRRSALDIVGGFDEAVRYGEDFTLGCDLAGPYPAGFRLADVDVEIHDVGTLDDAVGKMAVFGRALPHVARRCPDALALAGVAGASRSALVRALARPPLVRRWAQAVVPRLPRKLQPRAVRYLLGLTLLSAFAGARDRSS